ncbi:MAG: esterase, partial [Pseudonocardia sp.]|nr:esterase [Pseudonocardia sp.]
RGLGLVGPDGPVPDVPAPVPVRTDRLRSAARGCEVTMVTMRPQPGLPVCLLLHGRYTDARGMIDLGLPSFLAAYDGDGLPPFTVVALDGGDGYWVARTPADDPQAMLRAELPGWLAGLGLAAPSAVLGISMGGFGALLYARSTTVTAVLSPALFESWEDAEVAEFGHGAHTVGYWRRVLPDAPRFIGHRLDDRAR